MTGGASLLVAYVSDAMEADLFIAAVFGAVIAVIALVFFLFHLAKKRGYKKYQKQRKNMLASNAPTVFASVSDRYGDPSSANQDIAKGYGKLTFQDGRLIFLPDDPDCESWDIAAESTYVATDTGHYPVLYIFNEETGHLRIDLGFKSLRIRKYQKHNTPLYSAHELAYDWIGFILRAGGHQMPVEYQPDPPGDPFSFLGEI